MAKSKRQRAKQRSRRKRPPASRSRSRSSDPASELERELAAELKRIAARAEEAHDPRTAPERIATILIEDFEEMPAPPGFAEELATQETGARARAVLAELEARAGGTVTALSFAAELAHTLDHDLERARALLEQALDTDCDPAGTVQLAQHLVDAGMAKDALALLAEPLVEDPEDLETQNAYAGALGVLHARAAAGERLDASEREELKRFEDRSGIYSLRDALRELVDSDPDLTSYVEEVVEDWLAAVAERFDEAGVPDDDSDERDEALGRMAIEYAWVEPGLSEADGAWPSVSDAEGDPDEVSILDLLAAAPGTSPAITDAALAWRETVSFGLWQLADPQPRPGVWLTEIVTGTARYVAVAPEQLEQAPRWTVWLGAVVAVDGVWRTTGVLIPLRPGEADRAAEVVQEAIESFAEFASDGRVRSKRRRQKSAEPNGVMCELRGPAPPEALRITSVVVANLAPMIAGETWARRAAAPTITNMEGHRTKLITAQVTLGHADGAIDRLLEHPDFRAEDEDEDGTITWWGRELNKQELAQMRAQILAQFGEDALNDEDDEPHRWLRGRLRQRDQDSLEVEVNSEERLTALLDLLGTLGLGPAVTASSAIDPDMDLARIPAGALRGFGGSQASIDAWLEHWPEEQVPALGGVTPRAAASRKAKRPLLEALLREFEYDADTAIRAGRPAPDIARLREDLNMTVWSK